MILANVDVLETLVVVVVLVGDCDTVSEADRITCDDGRSITLLGHSTCFFLSSLRYCILSLSFSTLTMTIKIT
ncbi:hypothetical protein BX666DRAFT_1139038 [Dichotomocladium elegans]|nr:hypothetical protein BX666DRAFT_1139038 [Dichotomocladium elegans]